MSVIAFETTRLEKAQQYRLERQGSLGSRLYTIVGAYLFPPLASTLSVRSVGYRIGN